MTSFLIGFAFWPIFLCICDELDAEVCLLQTSLQTQLGDNDTIRRLPNHNITSPVVNMDSNSNHTNRSAVTPERERERTTHSSTSSQTQRMGAFSAAHIVNSWVHPALSPTPEVKRDGICERIRHFSQKHCGWLLLGTIAILLVAAYLRAFDDNGDNIDAYKENAWNLVPIGYHWRYGFIARLVLVLIHAVYLAASYYNRLCLVLWGLQMIMLVKFFVCVCMLPEIKGPLVGNSGENGPEEAVPGIQGPLADNGRDNKIDIPQAQYMLPEIKDPLVGNRKENGPDNAVPGIQGPLADNGRDNKIVIPQTQRNQIMQSVRSKDDRCHVVLVSHYKEERWMLERLLHSVDAAAANSAYPVTVVCAVEEHSSMMVEKWAMETTLLNHISLRTAVHKFGIANERPGLGSNLRNAVRCMIEDMNIPAVPGTMVSKFDGNCWIDPYFFAIMELEWSRAHFAPNIMFQFMGTEIGHEEWNLLPTFCRLNAYHMSATSIGSSHIVPYCGFAACFALPLDVIKDADSWDPWLLQEDLLMGARAFLARKGDLQKNHLVRSRVYNASPLDFAGFVSQRRRCVIHLFYALGFVFANFTLLSGRPWAMWTLASNTYRRMDLQVSGIILPMLLWLRWPTEFYFGDVAMVAIVGISFFMQAVAALMCVHNIAQFLEMMLLGPLFVVVKSMLNYIFVLEFFFLSRDSSETYATTPVMVKGPSLVK